jgi:hypothetical protein
MGRFVGLLNNAEGAIPGRPPISVVWDGKNALVNEKDRLAPSPDARQP